MTVKKIFPVMLKVIDILLMITWPFVVIYLVYQDKIQLLGVTLLGYFILRFIMLSKISQHNKKLVITLTVIGAGLTVLSLLLKNHEALLYYPPMVSMTLLGVFGYSLYKPPSLIEQLARLQTPNLTRKGIEYTYRVTQVWCLFFIFNAGISLLTIWSGDLELWTWWNGFLSYCFIGLLFVGEWCIRKRVQRNMLNQPPYQPISQWLSGLPSMPRLLHQKKMINQQQLQQKVAAIYTEIAQHSAQECVLLCHDSYYFIIALLATLHTGKTPVLLGHNNLDKLLGEHDNQQLILTDGKIEKSDKLWSIPHMLETTSVQTSFTLPAINPQTALILYTSGSSGNAKKVVKTVESMDIEARWLAQRWQTQFNTSLVKGSVSHNHLYGLTFRIWLPLSMGYLIDTQMVEFPEQLMDETPFIFITSPVFLHYMDTTLSPPTWALMVSAGGVLAPQLAQKIFDWSGTAIHEIYGSTETGIIAYREQPSQSSGWQPFSELSLIPCGEQRYQLYSPLLCGHQPFLLDDKLSFTENGCFELLGRVDRIIKIGDKRVSITEIENKLRQFELIDDVEIGAVQRNNRTYLGAVVVTSTPTEKLSQQQISAWRQELKKCIDPIAIPRFWRQVTTIPLNNQSKRSWSQLQELFNVSH